MNPIIKFTTLFGLLAVELAISLDRTLSAVLAGVFLLVSFFFVWRSFYGMRIGAEAPATRTAPAPVHEPEHAHARTTTSTQTADKPA